MFIVLYVSCIGIFQVSLYILLEGSSKTPQLLQHICLCLCCIPSSLLLEIIYDGCSSDKQKRTALSKFVETIAELLHEKEHYLQIVAFQLLARYGAKQSKFLTRIEMNLGTCYLCLVNKDDSFSSHCVSRCLSLCQAN